MFTLLLVGYSSDIAGLARCTGIFSPSQHYWIRAARIGDHHPRESPDRLASVEILHPSTDSAPPTRAVWERAASADHSPSQVCERHPPRISLRPTAAHRRDQLHTKPPPPHGASIRQRYSRCGVEQAGSVLWSANMRRLRHVRRVSSRPRSVTHGATLTGRRDLGHRGHAAGRRRIRPVFGGRPATGCQFISAIRQDSATRDSIILVVSGYVRELKIGSSRRQCGADRFSAKPLLPLALLDEVLNGLTCRRERRRPTWNASLPTGDCRRLARRRRS